MQAQIIDFFGDLRFSFRPTKVTDENIRAFLDTKPDPGTVLLTGTYWTLSRLCIPGSLTHAALYIGNREVIEALSPKPLKQSVYTTLLHADYFVALYPRGVTKKNDADLVAIERAYECLDFLYDCGFGFKDGDFLIVCTELIQYCFKDFIDFGLNEDGILTADMIYDHPRKEVVFESAEFANKNYLNKDFYYYSILMLIIGLLIKLRK